MRGRLLIANGSLFDPNFRQAVILVVEHRDDGAIGVVLNRAASITVADAAPAFAPLTGPSATIFIGGPVQPDAALVLAEAIDPTLLGSVVFGDVGVLALGPGQPQPPGVTRTRVFAGYAGWGPGQLENELEESSWILDDPVSDDVFTEEPQNLWREVLRRKGGSFAMLATMPYDPARN